MEQPQRIDLDTLQRTFKAYQSLSEMPRIEVTQHSHLFKDTTHCGFREILGDLLMTDIYQEDTMRNRYQLRPDWRTARPMFHFIKGYANFCQEQRVSLALESLTAYCEKVEREKIQSLIDQTQGGFVFPHSPWQTVVCLLRHHAPTDAALCSRFLCLWRMGGQSQQLCVAFPPLRPT